MRGVWVGCLGGGVMGWLVGWWEGGVFLGVDYFVVVVYDGGGLGIGWKRCMNGIYLSVHTAARVIFMCLR